MEEASVPFSSRDNAKVDDDCSMIGADIGAYSMVNHCYLWVYQHVVDLYAAEV